MAQAQERRPASNWAPGSASPPPDPPQCSRAPASSFFGRHRRTLRRLGVAASLLIIAVSATIFVRTLLRIDVNKFKAAIAATGGDQITLAFAFTALSYLALTGYDGLALRHLGIKVPYWLTALASFASYAVSFTLGFPLVTGGAIRYWLYAPAGLTAGKIASLTIVAGVTFWLGMGFIVGVGFMTASDAVAEINHFHPLANRLIGLSVLAALDRLSRLGRQHALARLPDRRQLSNCRAHWSPWDRWRSAWWTSVRLQPRSTFCFPKARRSASRRSRRSIPSRPCSASPAIRRAGSACSRRRSSRVSAATPTPCSRRCCCFVASIMSAPFIGAMALLGGVEAMRRWRSIREAMTAPSDD